MTQCDHIGTTWCQKNDKTLTALHYRAKKSKIRSKDGYLQYRGTIHPFKKFRRKLQSVGALGGSRALTPSDILLHLSHNPRIKCSITPNRARCCNHSTTMQSCRTVKLKGIIRNGLLRYEERTILPQHFLYRRARSRQDQKLRDRRNMDTRDALSRND